MSLLGETRVERARRLLRECESIQELAVKMHRKLLAIEQEVCELGVLSAQRPSENGG